MKQMSGMGQSWTNREQCSTPEEAFVGAQAPSDEITTDSVNKMVNSSSTLLCVILSPGGECLNGHTDVMKDLLRGRQGPEGIAPV
jgi:hypothetical protein